MTKNQIDYIKSQYGIQTVVMAFGRSCSMKLKENADDFFDLSVNPDKYLMANTKRDKKKEEWDTYGTKSDENEDFLADYPELGPEEDDCSTKRAYAL